LVLTIFGLSLGVLGILATILIAIRQRRPKRIVYDITAHRRIITQTGYQVTKPLVVSYGDRKLSDPYLVVVRIANTGKMEIRPEDWEEPLSLTVGSEIVDSGIVGTSSRDLKVEVTHVDSRQIRCSKILLNPGEWFDIQMLVDGPGNMSEASARIAGARLEPGKSPKPPQRRSYKYRRKWWNRYVIVGAVVVFSLAFEVVVLMNLGNSPTTRVPELVGGSAIQVVPDLHRAKLHLGNERFISSPGPSGTIVDQYPSAGSQVDLGSEVSIVIAKHG
jgi:hypothetical protein